MVVGGVGGTYTRVSWEGKQRVLHAFFWRFFGVPALLLDSSRPLCSFFVPSSNYDLAGALHGFLAALGATLGAGNATDHRPSLHRSPIQTRRNPVHHFIERLPTNVAERPGSGAGAPRFA